MPDTMLFPPTERERVLSEVRSALTAEMDRLCRATREACECDGDGDIHAFPPGGACMGCPRHAGPHITRVLDRLARGRADA